jgi:hypothetical protein
MKRRQNLLNYHSVNSSALICIVNSSRKFSTGLAVSKWDDERFDGAAFIPHFRIILSYQATQSTSQGAGEKNDNISFD